MNIKNTAGAFDLFSDTEKYAAQAYGLCGIFFKFDLKHNLWYNFYVIPITN